MTLDSPLDSKEIKPVNPKGNQPWIFIRRTSAEAEAPILWPLMWRTDFLEKTLMLGKIKSREGGGRGWDGWMTSLTHGHEFEQTQVNSEGQGSLPCCCSCGCKESDTTSWLNNNNLQMTFFSVFWLWDYSYKHLNQYRAFRASLVAQMVKNLPAMWETWVQSLGQEDPLEKELTIHSSILAWRILWTEKPGGLQSVGSQRVRHSWATNTQT